MKLDMKHPLAKNARRSGERAFAFTKAKLSTMNKSQLAAIGLVAVAVLWIASGIFRSHEPPKPSAAQQADASKNFRVAVMDAQVVSHSRKLVLSGRTEADKKVMAVARTGGVLTELKVKRGSVVKQGDVIAVLSDDAREAQVAQAKALLDQRKAELDAKRQLVASNAIPRLEMSNLEAQYKAAQASYALAEAERERGIVVAPWSGVVTDTPAEVGTAAFSFAGKEIAQIVSLDPLLAVVEVSERKLAGVRVGEQADVRLVTGQTATGRVRYVSKSASDKTRTYRVEVEIKNPDMSIPDGITAEVALPVAATPATRVPRSALTFSSKGELGVRTVGGDSLVGFTPVSVVEDEQTFMWVAGIAEGARVIVQGQDFVREGQQVVATTAPPVVSAR